MRNLKKVLALALAVVMLVGMMAMGAGATNYADAADIDNNVAVSVVDAIKVIEGFEDGTFQPEGKLTRAQAAIIIARLALTRTNADSLGFVPTLFTDVDAGYDWASAAIAWAAKEGIIAGNGDGTFNPAGNVTGYQFAKMLLVVLGYNAEHQKYIKNTDWATEVAYDAMMAGLLKGIDTKSLANDLTRDQAALMTFNALTATVVDYTNDFVISGENLSIAAKPELYEKGYDAENWINDEKTGTTTLQLCELLYPELKAVINGEDDFGRPGTQWTLNDAPVVVDVAKPVASFYTYLQDAAGQKAVFKALKGYYYMATVDGEQVKTEIDEAWAAENVADETWNGVLVEVFANPATKVVTEVTTVDVVFGEVVKVVEATETTERYIKVETAIDTFDFETEGYAVEDKLLVYLNEAQDEIVSVETPDKITDTLKINKVYTDGERNVGFHFAGEKQLMHGNEVAELEDENVGTKYDVWYDNYGFVIAVTETEEDPSAPNYGYVLKITLDAGTYNNEDYATILFADGSVDTVKTNELNGKNANTGKWDGWKVNADGSRGDNIKDTYTGKIVTYSTNTAGTTYYLTPVETVKNDGATVSITKGEEQITVDGDFGYYLPTNVMEAGEATADTTVTLDEEALTQVMFGRTGILMVVYDEDGEVDEEKTKFVRGFADVENILLYGGDVIYTYDNAAYTAETSKDNDILFMIVDVTNNRFGYKPQLVDWVYVLSEKPTRVTVLNSNGVGYTQHYVYEVLQGGVETTIKTYIPDDAADVLQQGEFYAVVTQNAYGFVSVATANADAGIATYTINEGGVVAVENNVIGVGEFYYALAEDIVCYVIDEADDADLAAVSVGKLKTDPNDTVTYVTLTDPKTKVSILTHIFVKKVADPEA